MVADRVSNSPQNLPLLGFGEHSVHTSFKELASSKKVYRIGMMILFGGAAAASIAILVTISLPAVLTGSLAMTTVGAFVGLSILALRSCKEYIAYRKGPSTASLGLNAADHNCTPLGVDCLNLEGFPCKDSRESTEWKLRLVGAAEYSVALSGSYCGGEVFDKMLDIIRQKMEGNRDFRACILSSNRFLTPANRQRLESLQKDFGRNFTVVETPFVLHLDPGIKISSNHTKLLVVDHGRYFVNGGSGLQDEYAHDKYGVPHNSDAGMNKSFLARRFRDMDFVYFCPDRQGIGLTLYLELLKLAARWKYINRPNGELDKTLYASHPFSRFPAPVLPEFARHPAVFSGLTVKAFATGPEHTHNPFSQELVRLVDNAKDSIVIDHLYFHPSKELLDALIRASNRGVNISIITNKSGKNSPRVHVFFGEPSRYYYSLLFEGKSKPNIKVYEYNLKDTTLHKKVILIDGEYVIAGSGNCGYKSLVSMSDHELNLITKSGAFAQAALQSVHDDIRDSKPVPPERAKKIPLSRRLNAVLQHILAPFIG